MSAISSPPRVFVSYSRGEALNDQRVSAIVKFLRDRDMQVWRDVDSIVPGTDWKAAIEDGLRASQAVLLVGTEESLNSRWVQAEIQLAKDLEKPIIPVLLDKDVRISDSAITTTVPPIDLTELADPRSQAAVAYSMNVAELEQQTASGKDVVSQEEAIEALVDLGKYDVFLSYSHSDGFAMQRVRSDFQASKLRVWTDERIEKGTLSWKVTIEKAITNSESLVALMSPEAHASRWVRAEIDYAEMKDKPVFIVIVRGEPKEVVPFGYASSQWTDVRNADIYPTAMGKLITALVDKTLSLF